MNPIAELIQSFIYNNSLGLQSSYRAKHSTETALLKVFIDIRLAIDKILGLFLGLLDLSAKFDNVDYHISMLDELPIDRGYAMVELVSS